MFYFETDSSIILTDLFRRCATSVLAVSSMEMESWSPRHAQFQSSLSPLKHQKYKHVSSQRDFLCVFCCCCPAPDHTVCLRRPACFTICFCLNVPLTIQMTSGPQLPLCINTWLCRILLYHRDAWCNQPNVLAFLWVSSNTNTRYANITIHNSPCVLFICFVTLFFLLFCSSSNSDKC